MRNDSLMFLSTRSLIFLGGKMIYLKRAYEPASKKDGYRILVDRLWPRGMSKEKLPLDEWSKEISPSSELRKEFGHMQERWASFAKAYKAELHSAAARGKLLEIAKRSRRGPVTLIYGAKDEIHNNAIVLKSVIEHLKH
jgi:uncharacterized protein YeaO (DUF488 family)